VSDSAHNFPYVCSLIAKEGPTKYYNSSDVRLQKNRILTIFVRTVYAQHVVSDCAADFSINSNLW
jgi:hypothetical protein